ncbi:MAG: GNAT family N-acetyltransferase [Dehalococcoidales bacterium]|nr:GNAT family N-acetyltransferase [Dehalococcoidales bacterium]
MSYLIKEAVSEKEKKELDLLLWSVLWKPLGMPRNMRMSFQLSGPEMQLVAMVDHSIIGGLVANWHSSNDIEIRHLAVKLEYQGISIGQRLVRELIKRIPQDKTISIQTYARNTSVAFFTKLGFKHIGERLEHPDFSAQGISFQKLYLEVP